VQYAFNAGQLTGTTSAGLKLVANFKYVTSGSAKPPVFTTAFTGCQTSSGTTNTWNSSQISNDLTQWIGTYQTNTVSPTNGSWVPNGPTLTIEGSAGNFKVSLTVGGITTVITNPVYQTTGNTLYWSNQNVQGGSQFNNAAISFYIDGAAQTRGFKGVFFVATPAPKAVNWSGALSQNTGGGGGGGGVPPWVWVIVGIAGAAVVGFLIKWAWARAFPATQNATYDTIEMAAKKCQ
jgi:hypothetical protein